MRATVTALVALSAACAANVEQIREIAKRGDRLVIVAPEASALEPGQSLMFANPLYCAYAIVPTAGDPITLLVSLGSVVVATACAGAVGAFDLVALPVSAVNRHGQGKEIERIVTACPLSGPSAAVAERVATGLAASFGFSGIERGVSSASDALLEIRVEKFAWSGRFELSAQAVLRDRSGAILWRSKKCDERSGEAPDLYVGRCEAMQADVSALAESCSATIGTPRP